MRLAAKSSLRKTWLELGLLFLPGIPAYLWIWNKWSGDRLANFQLITYLYILTGALWIGLRRYHLGELGINLKGISLSLSVGGAILFGRWLIIHSVDWSAHPGPLTIEKVVGDLFFYFFCVGLVEELVFRGLIYRLLEDWRGGRWAVVGSSIGFVFWHIFGQGILLGIAMFFIGLIFGVIRRKAGGILGLIIIHALWDIESAWLVASSNADILSPGGYALVNRPMALAGTLIMIAPAVLLSVLAKDQDS